MLINQFLLENFHFALNIFASLVFFAVAWLYLDAYFTTKIKKQLIKIAGFFLISLGFLIRSSYIEQTILVNPVFSLELVTFAGTIAKALGYFLVIVGLFTEPIQKRPDTSSQDQAPIEKLSVLIPFQLIGLSLSFKDISIIVLSLFSLSAFLMFLKRSTIGLEKHLKALSFGFLFIFLSDIFGFYEIFQNTTSIYLYKLFAPFGLVWILAQIALLLGVVIIGKWVFSYLLKRLQTQVFMIFNTSVLIIFLVTTISFTFLLLNNLKQNALTHLDRDARVVKYAIDSKQAETLSDAELVSQNPQLQTALLQNDKSVLKNLAISNLITKKKSFVVITASTGAVLARGEDSEKIGDSVSSDPLFIRALRGDKVSSVIVRNGVLSPTVSLRSAVPIVSSGSVIGVVMLGMDIDNAFSDGLKNSTGLDVSVYAGNVLSATTFIAEDGKSRYIGVKENNKNINKTVLIEGKNYSGELAMLNIPYLAAFTPLKDLNNNPVGMIFVGEEQVSVLQAASHSIEYTFIISILLILISVYPSFVISKFIANQFK